jgi:tetratricopeptide (TPR) repeat protein
VEYGQEAVDLLGERGMVAVQAAQGTILGRCLCELGRFDEAAAHAEFTRDIDPDDWSWRLLQARVHAFRGEHAEAERLAREGIAICEASDQLTWQGDAWWDLAEVLLAAGKTEDAIQAFEQALARHERKKNLAMVAQVQPRLEALRAPTSR